MALDVELTTAQGLWLRHAPAGTDPTVRPTPPDDNRWQRGRVVDALYLCDQEACVWGEWYRHLAERGLPPHLGLPRDLWIYELDATEVADLRTVERLARVGLAPPVPGRRSWPTYQAVGARLHREGYAGLIAPSAARPQSLVLCLFVHESGRAAPLTPSDPPRRVTHPPAPPTGMRT